MSFDLAFWVGTAPANDDAARAELKALHARYTETPGDPHPTLLAFLADATAAYPDLMDLSDENIDDGVWSDGPLTNNVLGPLLYLGIVWSRAEEVAEFLTTRAAQFALVVYDPQSGTLRSPAAN